MLIILYDILENYPSVNALDLQKIYCKMSGKQEELLTLSALIYTKRSFPKG